jgi:hypothetical protein
MSAWSTPHPLQITLETVRVVLNLHAHSITTHSGDHLAVTYYEDLVSPWLRDRDLLDL